MTTTINASTSAGLVQTADTSGSLALQTAGTTAVTIDTSQTITSTSHIVVANGSNLGWGSNNIGFSGNSSTGVLSTYTAGSERMRIDSSGHVGIGTSSPISILTVGNGAAANKVLTINGGTGSGLGAGIVLQRNSTQTAIFSTDSLIGGTADGASVWSSEATRFYTGGSNERMRIDSSGNLLVGTTSVNGLGVTISGTQGNNFWVSNTTTTSGYNQFAFKVNGTTVGNIQTTSSNTSYITTSDYRLKENVSPMTGALNTVSLLKPVTYKWKLDGKNGQGFIAHELQEVVPEAVAGEKDAVDEEGNPIYQGIDTSFLVATLTAAIQEQQALITNLTTRLAALEGAK